MAEPICIGDIRVAESRFSLVAEPHYTLNKVYADRGDVITIVDKVTSSSNGKLYYVTLLPNLSIGYSHVSWIGENTRVLSRDPAKVAKLRV